MSLSWNELLRQLYQFLLALPIILFSLSAHEFAHAYISRRLGDPTPEMAGRLRLNPLTHLDPIGTLMLILTTLSTGGRFAFGWAKPVPINPRYYRNPLRGTFQVGLAGPLANLALAALFGLGFRFAYAANSHVGILLLLTIAVGINLGLCLFNLIPVPPLDGSKILAYFLRGAAYRRYLQWQQYGFLVLLALIVTGALGRIIGPPLDFLFRLLTGLNG